jgi:hypothetical protein
MLDAIDQYGLIQIKINELEEFKNKLKAEILARGVGVHSGLTYFADVQEYDRENISAPLVRKFSNEEFVKSVTTIQHITSVSVKLLEV